MNGFDALPAGCSVTMERVAKETVLENIRQCFTGKKGLLPMTIRFALEEKLTGELLTLCRPYGD